MAREQGVVDTLYGRLDELREATWERLRAVRREGPSGSPQNRSERDAFATLYEDRVAQLRSVEDRLVFGRLDLADGTTRYVGRIGLTDPDQTPLLTDWRAPAAQSFYRATAAHPDDVARRRHLTTRRRQVLGIEDDVLDLAATEQLGLRALAGEGALLASLGAGRTARMHDIVATIQREQDEIIRAPLAGTLVVQGGPGTGKTAVALHRTAYLLYAHRRQLERTGVLLVGPSRAFLHYIDQVLPSLGETGVVSTTIADLLPGVTVTATEDAEVAEIKGRAVWSRILTRAVRARERVPAQDVRLVVEGQELVLRRGDVRDALGRARRAHRPHNEARAGFARDVLGRIAAQYAEALGDPEADRAELLDDLRRSRDVRVAVNLAWLPITPARLVEDLFTKPHRLAEAAPELTAEDRARLARPAGSGWTASDVPLLDEAAELLGEDDALDRAEARERAEQAAADLEYARQVLESSGAGGGLVDAETLAGRFADGGPVLTTAERAAADRTWAYGHVVVDEAQELTPMAWRALVRRCPTRSFTVVGDVAQTTALGGARSWAAALRPHFRDAWSVSELTVNYRTPATVADSALRFARAAHLPVSRLSSARDVDDALRLVRVARTDELAPAAATHAVEQVGEVVRPDGTGRVAVVVEPGRRRAVTDALTAALAGAVGPERAGELLQGGADARVVVLTPVEVKGLEFDAVVVVEPAEIVGDGRSGASDLYVSLTRPTRRLVAVHHADLPAGLVDAG
ncbi:HelD family protein [Luteimicrobium xylanilyticum]|uniref:HelD family protein n=1 Tax=Luteimicrobium xylanilyticum TaxID=1133546 RepID=UPI001D14D5C3|nr:UvrD-helicase domain-containing protein [Luteimicrobium xylanilyticum]